MRNDVWRRMCLCVAWFIHSMFLLSRIFYSLFSFLDEVTKSKSEYEYSSVGNSAEGILEIWAEVFHFSVRGFVSFRKSWHGSISPIYICQNEIESLLDSHRNDSNCKNVRSLPMSNEFQMLLSNDNDEIEIINRFHLKHVSFDSVKFRKQFILWIHDSVTDGYEANKQLPIQIYNRNNCVWLAIWILFQFNSIWF